MPILGGDLKIYISLAYFFDWFFMAYQPLAGYLKPENIVRISGGKNNGLVIQVLLINP